MVQRILVLLLLSSIIGFPTTSSLAQVTVVNERSINTAFQEYSPAFFQQGLVFIAANPAINKDKKEDTQVGKTTTSIFFAKRNGDGNLQRPVAFAEELTTKFYDGPLTFNAAGNVVFFTRSNLKKGKPKAGKDGNVKLKIYTAKLNATSGKWEDIVELPFNNNDYDCMHPSVSVDGQRLYFTSNRPGGKGGYDLYVSLLQNGVWSDPVNLGPSVNTVSDDVAPFIHPDNTLYFSTKGRKAVGGMDIFWTKKTEEGWLEPAAMPEPINTPSDDFGLIMSADKKTGFFSSNRASGQGDDDIFSFSGNNGEAQTVKTEPKLDETKVEPTKPEVQTPVRGQESALVQNQPQASVQAQAAVQAQVPIQAPAPSQNQPQALAQVEPAKIKKEAVTVLKEQPKISENEVDLATQQTPSEHTVAAVTVPIEKVSVSNMLSVEISAFDKIANTPIPEASVTVLNMKSIKNATFMTDATGKVTGLRAESGANIPLDILPSQEVITDANGHVTLSVNNGDQFIFNFSKAGYQSKYVVKTVIPSDSKVAAFMSKPNKKPLPEDKKSMTSVDDTTSKQKQTRSVAVQNPKERLTDFEEKPSSFAVTEPTTASDSYLFDLKTAYTRTDDATLSEKNQIELQPLLKMMVKDSRIEIEIGSHTDTRGKANSNLTVSQLRADNIKTFFVENGIAPERIRSFGYGETMLRNKCKRGVTCTDAEHAANVRAAIKVVKGIETERISEINPSADPTKKTMKVGSTTGSDLIASTSQNAQSLVAAPTTSKKYYVVIGTFTKPENAQKHRKKAIDAGFVEAEVIKYQDTYLYGVSVRTLPNMQEARKLTEYINSQKEFEAFIKEWQ
jgi:outer membrane protein OmpA-like peptidoglycan-associated protein